MLTLVFTDLVNSTAVKVVLSGSDLRERNQTYLRDILVPHRERFERFLAEFHGRIAGTVGDGYFLVFDRATDAARFSIALQIDLIDKPLLTPMGPLKVRIGMHSGDPLPDPNHPGQYVGQEIDYAARLGALAEGGQIVISQLTKALLEDEKIQEARPWHHGDRNLKGIGAVPVFELLYANKESQPLREAALAPDNLPPPPRLVAGRSDLIAELREYLHQGGVVILRAEGGMGKTTLALTCAHDALRAGEIPGGVVWVNCETGPSHDECLRQAASLFFGDRSESEPTAALAKRIAKHLVDNRGLIVLDNFETVAGDNELIRWIAEVRAPARILITTRVTPQGLAGQVISVMELTDDAAITLFYTLTKKAGLRVAPPRPTVTALCNWVGCQPLGIELLAARAVTVPITQLLKQLETKGIGVLDARGDPTKPSRHQSSQACISLSFESVSVEAQTLLQALSVLPAAFNADLVAHVTGTEAWYDAADELINASLWRLVGDLYSVHPLVRQFALERLGNSRGEAERTAAVGVTKAIQSWREHSIQGTDAKTRMNEFLDWCSAHLPNIVAVIGYAKNHQQWQLLLDLAKATSMFWNVRGYWLVAEQLGDAALAAALNLGSVAEEAFAYGNLVFIYRHAGKYHEAEEVALRGEAACDRTTGCDALRMQIYAHLGKLHSVIGRQYDVATNFLEKSLVGYRVLGDRNGEVTALAYLAQNTKYKGDFPSAIRLFKEALPLARAVEDVHIEREILYQLGDTEMMAGRYAESEQHLQESLVLANLLNNKEAEARILSDQGYVALKTGDTARAHELLSVAIQIHRETGFRQREGRAMRRLAEVALARGDRAAASEIIQKTMALLEKTQSRKTIERAQRIMDAVKAAAE